MCPGFISSVAYKKVNSGVECVSNDEKLGSFSKVEECANACRNKTECHFFVYGTGTIKSGWCYWEKTSNSLCHEGWEDDDYDFYQLNLNKSKYYSVGLGYQKILLILKIIISN